jgi:phage I-like protein
MMRKNTIDDRFIICDAHELTPVQQDDGRIELCVALTGEWKSRELKVRDKELGQMLDNYRKEGRDILFDYDHKCLGGFLSEADSRAAGWGKAMEIRDGALYVQMEPTARGREAIEAGEYRYLSPVYEYQRTDRVSGKVMKDWRLHSVALTNTPYLTELPAIKNTEDNSGGNNMDELLKRLNANDEESALAKLQELLDELDLMRATNSGLLAKLNEAEIDKAVQEQKLLPAQKGLAAKLLNQSRELFDEFIANAVIPDLTTEVQIQDGGDDGLDPFKGVQSFGDLLRDPELAKQMETEAPERYNALYAAYMRGGV